LLNLRISKEEREVSIWSGLGNCTCLWTW